MCLSTGKTPADSDRDCETGSTSAGDPSAGVPPASPGGGHTQSPRVLAPHGSSVPRTWHTKPEAGWILPPPPASSKHDTRSSRCGTFKAENRKHRAHPLRKEMEENTRLPQGHQPTVRRGRNGVLGNPGRGTQCTSVRKNLQHVTKQGLLFCYCTNAKKIVLSVITCRWGETQIVFYFCHPPDFYFTTRLHFLKSPCHIYVKI